MCHFMWRMSRPFRVQSASPRSGISLGAFIVALVTGHVFAQQSAQGDWKQTFTVARSALAATGRNTYVILEPGYRLELADAHTRLTITVLAETKVVDSVETRVVEERETRDGALVEVSRNYFAIDRLTRDLYYFGEDVDEYRNGRVTSHEGSWLAGVGGARFGLMMSDSTRRYYEELAPRVAMDRAAVISDSATVATPAGTYAHCRKIEETTPLEPDAREFKYYAPGVGIVQDGSLKLVRISASR